MEDKQTRGIKLPVFKNAVAYRANSPDGIDPVIKGAIQLSKGDNFILVLKDSREVEERLLPAYLSAVIRHNDGSMHSRSLSIETILFTAGTMNISNAVKRLRADGKGFIIFSTSAELARILFSKSNIRKFSRCRLGLDPTVTSDVALTAIKEDK